MYLSIFVVTFISADEQKGRILVNKLMFTDVNFLGAAVGTRIDMNLVSAAPSTN